jgi:hypothetical protein
MKFSKLINYLTDVCGSCQGSMVYNKKLNSKQIDNKEQNKMKEHVKMNPINVEPWWKMKNIKWW